AERVRNRRALSDVSRARPARGGRRRRPRGRQRRRRRGLAVRRGHRALLGQPLCARGHGAALARRGDAVRRRGVSRGLGLAGVGGVGAALTPRRCAWASGAPAMIRYHDREWGVPVHDDRRLFEFLVLEGAQAGPSWLTVLRKRERYRTAFHGFDPRKIARYEASDLNRLLADDGIIRNRLKITSAIRNARAFLEVQKESGTF